MSEDIQASNRRPPRDYKSKKFAEGRLKLSTSCVECHRRKQKCDQKQPCNHCSRRYPPPVCIYRRKGDTPTSNDQSSVQSVDGNQFMLLDEEESSRQVQNHASSSILDQESNDLDLTLEALQSIGNPKSSYITMNTLGKFDPETYQDLLSTMASQISSGLRVGVVDGHESGNHEAADEMGVVVQGNSGWLDQAFRNHFQRSKAAGSPSKFSITSVDPLHFLGITPTAQSSELLHAFLTIITKFVVSIDGNPPPNYYNDKWVPWSVKSPLLAHLGIFTASCYQAETQKVKPAESPVVLRYKVKCISLLNELLRNKDTATDCEAVAGVVYLMTNEWYWSSFESVQAHMNGLREMVKLRGGLGSFGMNDFVRKMVILTDYQIACSYNMEPSFPHNVNLRPLHPIKYMTPLVPFSFNFASNVEELQISEETAVILDDMRFLFKAVMKQVDCSSASEAERAKLSATSVWVKERMLAMPDGSTDMRLASDFVYNSCRLAALTYCRAIVAGVPLSKTCSALDLNHLWANMWRIKLSRWKQIPGIFLFVILSALPAAVATPHGRFLKSMLKTSASYIAIDNWELIDGLLMTFVRLQRWLRNGAEGNAEASKPESLEFVHIYAHR